MCKLRKHSIVFVSSFSCLLLLLIFLFATQSYASTPSVFVSSINNPIGIAASSDRVLVTLYGENPNRVWSIDSFGAQTVFATLPGTPSVATNVAISPGMGGFPSGSVYVTQGPNIYRISPDGTSVVLFKTIPSLSTEYNGITFDRVGSFGFDMIVTSSYNGEVWRLNSSGTATLLVTNPILIPGFGYTNLNAIRGPDVAPLTFAPYGGHLFVAQVVDPQGVYAVSPRGDLAFVATYAVAGGVYFVPNNPCNLGVSGGAFFVANHEIRITKYPASDFAGLGGTAIVTNIGFGAGLFQLRSTDTGIQGSWFDQELDSNAGAGFVLDCALPVQIDIKPGVFPNTVNPNGPGVIKVGIVTSTTFNATAVDKKTVRFGLTGTEAAPTKASLEDIDGDGDMDMIFTFNIKDTLLTCGSISAALTGKTRSGQSIEGSDSIRTVGCK